MALTIDDSAVFPEDLDPGVEWGSAYSTTVISTGSGAEQRLQQWASPRRTGTISVKLHTAARLDEFVSFFEARAGRLRGFRLKDPKDYEVTDEPLTHGGATEVQLTITYTSGGVSRVRNIYKPVSGTVTLKVNGTAYTNFLIDNNSGTVYLAAALAGGDTLTWSGQYHIPVRFDTDIQQLLHHSPTFSEWQNIPVIELRGAPTAVSPATDPLTLANLELYLRSDQATGTNGAAITGWNDLSSSARHTQSVGGATNPTLRTTGANISPNGKRTVQYSAVTDNRRVTFPAAPGLENANGLTIYAYYKQIALTDRGHMLFHSPLGNTAELLAYTHTANGYSTNGRLGYGDGNARRTTDAAAVTGWQRLTLVYSPPLNSASGKTRLYRNGVQVTPEYDTWDTDLESNAYIGNTEGSNSALDGAFGALLVYSTAHSDTTRLGVELWLRDYFEATS